MLTDAELRALCDAYHLALNGIHTRDGVARVPCVPGYTIFNLDSRKDPVDRHNLGTHWTCSVGHVTQVYYFDSFACAPPTAVHAWLKRKYGDSIFINNYIVQHLRSESCGHYCVALALYIKQNQRRTPNLVQCCNDFVRMFKDDETLNDGILKAYLVQQARRLKCLPKIQALLNRID